MYYSIEKKYKCSECGSISEPYTVTKGYNTFLKCKECGHERLYSTFTASKGTNPIVVNITDEPEIY